MNEHRVRNTLQLILREFDHSPIGNPFNTVYYCENTNRCYRVVNGEVLSSESFLPKWELFSKREEKLIEEMRDPKSRKDLHDLYEKTKGFKLTFEAMVPVEELVF